MSLFVIDASVAAKWFLPPSGEPRSAEARRLLSAYADGRVRFAVPDLFWAECANILWKAVRQGRWTLRDAEASITLLMQRPFPTTSAREVLEETFSIAITFDRSVYDSLYVALAVRLKADLVTADERLASALAAHLPVKWLGSLGGL